MLALQFIFGDEPGQDTFFKGPTEEQQSNLRVKCLTIAIDASIALFSPVGVPGELQVYEMVTAVLQVETFSSGIRGD